MIFLKRIADIASIASCSLSLSRFIMFLMIDLSHSNILAIVTIRNVLKIASWPSYINIAYLCNDIWYDANCVSQKDIEIILLRINTRLE